jgi:peptidyl-prolyl cis-trans isomerase A (cyclophilin A)
MNTFFRSLVVNACLLFAAVAAIPALAQTTMVRLHTTQGPIDMNVLTSEAPLTAANFLAYVRGGDYTEVFVHRSAWVTTPVAAPFVIQAGYYKWPESGCCPTVVSRGPVVNEFSATRSNVRGTVAMAKVGGDPNSATSQWFVNMGNNAANLDSQNGGFTVFARVTAPGMVVADRIAALPRVNAGPAFTELPVQNFQAGTTTLLREHVVRITGVTEFPASQTADERIFNYLEAAYPQYLSPSIGAAGQFDGYNYRYYSASNAYVGTKNGDVWYFVPALNGNINRLGSMTEWLGTAQAAGY